MYSIYSSAYCTLSALAAGDASGGLFSNRIPGPHPTISSVTWQWSNELVGPLTKRGWTFQEHQIFPRVIYFGQGKTLWECRQSSAVSDSLQGTLINKIPSLDTNIASSHYSKSFLARLQINRLCDTVAGLNLHTFWLKAAEQYSSRQLSHL